jgi:hypothetical protein
MVQLLETILVGFVTVTVALIIVIACLAFWWLIGGLIYFQAVETFSSWKKKGRQS